MRYSFTFSNNWGTDTVKGWAGKTIGISYGDDGSTQYDTLAAAGCFMDESSEKVFETENKGVLAVL